METTTQPKKKYKIEPLGDRAIVQPDPPETYTQTGLIIPETAKERPQLGTVIAVGDGRNQDNEIIHYTLRLLTFVIRILKFFKIEITPLEEKMDTYQSVKLKPGMRVLYGRYAGTNIEFDGQKILIMRFSDVVGIVHEE